MDMSNPGWTKRWIKKLPREDGGSVMELAFVLILLVPIVVLTTQLSSFIFASVELTDATHAAASFASQYYFENSNNYLPTQSQVTTAATNDAPELVAMSGTSFTATMATGCGTSAPTAGNSLPSCTTGNLPYVQVTGQATVSPIVSLIHGSTITMTSQARINLVK